MPRLTLVRATPIQRTPRVAQVEGIFDVPPTQRSEERWEVDLNLPREWNVGLIVGPSGSGKTTVAREVFGEAVIGGFDWPQERSLLDGFPPEMGIREITDLLSSVGFSSPPSWLRPYHVLSNGEQFRVTLARLLAELPDLAVMDEFTSVVDRTVARIGSAAVAKTVRKRGQRFVAVSCHYDIVEWLQPDWVYEPATNELARGCLQRRPDITLTLQRVDPAAWAVFRKHHYLDQSLHRAARCFVGFVEGKPAVFSSVLHFSHPQQRNIKREHRTVTLPDYQGVGLGNAVSALVGQMVRGLGCRYLSITAHPAMVRSRARSKDWAMLHAPSIKQATQATRATGKRKQYQPDGSTSGLFFKPATRLRASFEYVGPIMPAEQAQRLWSGL